MTPITSGADSADIFEYTLSYLIDHELDLSVFHDATKRRYGRPAYDPALLLKIVPMR